MATINSFQEMEEARLLPIVCEACGSFLLARKLDAECLYALHEFSYLRNHRRELVLLERTAALFQRFPETGPKIMLNVEHYWRDDVPKHEAVEDPQLEQALDADPELRKFLRESHFLLPARLEGTRQAISLREKLDYAPISCVECINGHYFVDWWEFQDV